MDRQDFYDIAFQAAVLPAEMPVERCCLLHPNGEYVRRGDLSVESLFTLEDVSAKVEDLLPEVRDLRRAALEAAGAADPAGLASCFSPVSCPCPGVCHPDLPEFSIYDIPHLTREKKIELRDRRILKAAEVPDDFPLNPKQRRIVDLARAGAELFDRRGLQQELARLVFPLHFLDYETCIAALPLFEGYHPQQQVVFQYSLHRMEQPGMEAVHAGHLSAGPGDPALPLLASLREQIAPAGSVIVWNKTFEMTRNREMAALHPQFAPFLEDLNTRIYDLGEIVARGIYLHPSFKGSWSIKNVLPVLVPALSYRELEVHSGDQASLAWWEIQFGKISEAEKQRQVQALEKYCRLDTLAMVEIYRCLVDKADPRS